MKNEYKLKRLFFLLLSIFVFSSDIFSAPTLSASVTQPTYPGTSKPYLTIVSGSGKTSYVSGVLNDPTDPAAVSGIYFEVTNATNVSFIITTGTSSVVPLSNITVIKTGNYYVLRILPTGVGYSNITVKSSDGSSSSTAYKINYAASAASSNPSKTIWPVNLADASGASSIDDDYMFVCDDETNVLRLYNRKNSGIDLYNFDISATLGAGSNECDLEGSSLSVKYNAGKRIYWTGSLGNNKSGALKPYRDRVIATDVTGTGAASTLSVKSYSAKFRTALISWGDANSWSFTTSAASGMIPKKIDGFNVEGLTVTHGGDTAYIGFRAPCVPVKGVTPTAANRKYAVIAPVTNFETIMNGSGPVSTAPVISEPILFDFEGLGIRSIERVGSNLYLIIAGLYTGGGSPAVYLWDGRIPASPGSNPITVGSTYSKLIKLNLPGLSELAQVSPDGGVEGHPEALVAEQYGQLLYIHLICDNGTIDYYGDGTEAKALTDSTFKKFRYDNFIYDMSKDMIGCPNSNMFFVAEYPSTGTTYQWQIYNGSGYTDITAGLPYSGTTADTLKLSTPPTSMYGTKYRCAITKNAVTTYSSEKTLKFVAYWTGAINNAWENQGNWSCNTLPDLNTDVIINKGTVVVNSNPVIRSLLTNPTVLITVNSGKALTVVH